MFESKNRFVTRKVAEEVPIATQIFLWSLIDVQVQKGGEVDYFQKFELRSTEKGQEIIHSQEVPKRTKKTLLEIPKENCLNKIIWVIDSEVYETMLFPDEY